MLAKLGYDPGDVAQGDDIFRIERPEAARAKAAVGAARLSHPNHVPRGYGIEHATALLPATLADGGQVLSDFLVHQLNISCL